MLLEDHLLWDKEDFHLLDHLLLLLLILKQNVEQKKKQNNKKAWRSWVTQQPPMAVAAKRPDFDRGCLRGQPVESA